MQRMINGACVLAWSRLRFFIPLLQLIGGLSTYHAILNKASQALSLHDAAKGDRRSHK